MSDNLQKRKYVIDQVNANSAIEGLEPSPAVKRIQTDYVEGRITDEQFFAALREQVRIVVTNAGGHLPPDFPHTK